MFRQCHRGRVGRGSLWVSFTLVTLFEILFLVVDSSAAKKQLFLQEQIYIRALSYMEFLLYFLFCLLSFLV